MKDIFSVTKVLVKSVRVLSVNVSQLGMSRLKLVRLVKISLPECRTLFAMLAYFLFKTFLV